MTGVRYFEEEIGLNCEHFKEKEQNKMWIRSKRGMKIV